MRNHLHVLFLIGACWHSCLLPAVYMQRERDVFGCVGPHCSCQHAVAATAAEVEVAVVLSASG